MRRGFRPLALPHSNGFAILTLRPARFRHPVSGNQALICDAEGLAEHIRFLKRRILGDEVVHHQTLPARPARLVRDVSGLPPALARILKIARIPALYTHQAEGIQKVLAGQHLALATPTASGKTLVYNAPVLATLLDDPEAHALYIFPLKALEQDQFDELNGLMQGLGGTLKAAIYDGDTPAHRRRQIRTTPPQVLFTTPDMLHSGILAFHEAWAGFFARLRYVVIDELHAYSGVFGSHVLHLFRRLNRICAHYGADPVYITSSATMGNPRELAGELLNRSFCAIEDHGAPAATRHFVFVNPSESPNTLAAHVLRASVLKDYRTIVFTRARITTELVYRWATQNRPDLQARISSYRAGYLPNERRQIEQALNVGQLMGVVATSALELGIDIGGLDICVLVGYPGSIINTWQRAGRVGRAGRESLILLIASPDALDQYFMRHPKEFFTRDLEDAVVDPTNQYILKNHLACAARELPLAAGEPEYALPNYRATLDALTEEGALLQNAEGDAWFAARKQPHRLVNMRTIGESYRIVDRDHNPIGTVSGGQVYGECYKGAIYLHRGRQYEIGDRNPQQGQIYAEEVHVAYFTRARTEKDTEILEELRSRPLQGFMARLGRLKVSSQVVGYEKIRVGDQVVLSKHPLESPVEHVETIGFWIELDAHFKADLSRHQHHYMGSIHAIEHAVKSLFPLLALCDRTDVGGICYPQHPQLGKGAIFVYDYHPGGIGLAEKGFAQLDRLLDLTRAMVETCDCLIGCPSCIHFPTCGAGNVPLDKAGAIHLLGVLTGHRAIERAPSTAEVADAPPIFAEWEQEEESAADERPEQGPRVVVFDLETQRSAAEVGGWNKAHLMGLSVGVVWDSHEQGCTTYLEKDIDRLLEHLQAADLIVGFNVLGFDYSVLRGYSPFDFRRLNTLDILREVHQQLRYRVSLDALGRATLDAPKSADGLDALRWFKQGRLDLIADYCQKDVELTRDLFYFGLRESYLLFDRKNEGRMRIPVAWNLEELASRGQML